MGWKEWIVFPIGGFSTVREVDWTASGWRRGNGDQGRQRCGPKKVCVACVL